MKISGRQTTYTNTKNNNILGVRNDGFSSTTNEHAHLQQMLQHLIRFIANHNTFPPAPLF